MNILDLNYLQNAEADVVGGSTKNVVLNSASNQKYNVDANVDVRNEVDSIIRSATKVSGNAATTNFENTALGKNTFVDTKVSNVVVEGKLSESSGILTAATNGSKH
jgi:hypothetical protein